MTNKTASREVKFKFANHEFDISELDDGAVEVRHYMNGVPNTLFGSARGFESMLSIRPGIMPMARLLDSEGFTTEEGWQIYTTAGGQLTEAFKSKLRELWIPEQAGVGVG